MSALAFAGAPSASGAIGVSLLPVLDEGAGASGSDALPAVHVQIGSLVNIEAAPLPAKVEVAGLPPIETPSLPRAEAPSTPPVESPRLPEETSTTPTAGTPAPISSGSSPSSNQPAQGGARAGDAAVIVPTATTAADSSKTAADTRGMPASTSTERLTHSGGHEVRGTHAARRPGTGVSAVGAEAAGASPAQTVQAGSASTRDGGSARRAEIKGKSFASDPLGTIGSQLPFPAPVPDWSRPIILVLLLLAIALAIRARLATSRARRLQTQHTAMLSDLDEMQKALVPAVPERLAGLGVSVAYRPADGPAAGGDFYDLFALDGERVAIVVGDVVGHGRRALAQAALTRYTLRAYLQAGLEPRAALALAGSVLSTPGEKRFATVVIAVHDGPSGRLTYACAGHPPPITVGFEALEPIAVCCSAPICSDLPTGRRQTVLSLPGSGSMCFFSDGLPEARVGEDLLGRKRLTELLDELGPSAKAPTLLERVRREASAAQDDMVACIITSLARSGASAVQVEELEVDPEMLASPRVRYFLEACGLDRGQIASTLARASELAGQEGRALVRVERPRTDGSATASVDPCSAVHAFTSATTPGPPPELALALSSTR